MDRRPGHASAAGLARGLSLYVPFDGSAAAVVAGGAPEVRAPLASYVPGRVGEAVTGASPHIEAFHPGNMNAAVGTVAFWVRPDWLETPDKAPHRQFFRCKWVNLVYGPDKRRLFFMTGDVRPPDGFRWDYSVSTTAPGEWQQGEWHHLAFSWDAATGAKALYIDGQSVSTGTTELLSDDNAGNAPITLGTTATGAYDEWAVWDRVLSAAEVEMLARTPEAAARAMGKAAGNRPMPVSASWPICFGIHVIKPSAGTIIEPGGAFTATVPVVNNAETPFTGWVAFLLLDFRARERGAQRQQVEMQAGESRELKVTFTSPLERGVFKIAVRLEHEGAILERDVSAFATWPHPSHPPDPDSFFGNHVNSWYGGDYIRQAARLGLSWVRGHDMLQATWWGIVQPDPGDFAWTYEDHIAEYREHGMPILGTLTGTPWWATANGPKAKTRPGRGYSDPPDLALWRIYCEQTLKRYAPVIRHWEIYNEPAVSIFWNGTPEEHAEVVRIACEVARKVDPGLTVMASGYTAPSWRWHEANAKAGAWRDLDVLSVHLGAFGIPEVAARQLALNLRHFRELLERYGPGWDTPIWSTEGGVPDTTWFRGLDFPGLPPERLRPPVNAREGAIRVVQGSAIMQSQGIRKHFVYLQNFPGHGPRSYLNTAMIDVNNAPRPKLMARVAMAEQTDGCILVGDVHRLDDARFWAFVYRRPDPGPHATILWWCGDEGQITLRAEWPGPAMNQVDIFGNAHAWIDPIAISDEPSYAHVEAPPESVIEALRKATITVVRTPAPLPESPAGEEDRPDVPDLPDYVAPTENPAGVFTLDLRPFCTMGFADEKAGDGKGGWSDEGPMNDLRDMPVGRRHWYGVPFDIVDPRGNDGRSVIALRGRNATPTLPQSVRIEMPRRRVRCFYILHAAAWGLPGNIGAYRVHYADGTEAAIPNEIPLDNGNWWNGWHPDENSRPVPIRATHTASGRPAWRYLRVLEWENASPDLEIVAVTATSAGGTQTPILLALSGVER